MTREGLAWLLTFLIGIGCGGAGVIFYQAACKVIDEADVAISRRRHPSTQDSPPIIGVATEHSIEDPFTGEITVAIRLAPDAATDADLRYGPNGRRLD